MRRTLLDRKYQMSDQLYIELSEPVRQFIDARTQEDGIYNSPSAYLQDLVRRDMAVYQEARDVANLLRLARLSPLSELEPDFIGVERTRLQALASQKNTTT